MTADRSQHDRDPADERAVRAFLERAAPIILEARELEGDRFRSVCAVADELGLTRDQLACELRLLEQRGVISSAPWAQLEESAGANRPRPDAVADDAQRSVTAQATSEPRQPAAPAHRGTDAVPGTASSPPPPPDTDERPEVSPSWAALEALRTQAWKQITRHGTLRQHTRRKLEKAGRQAGLSAQEIASVLDTLPDPTAVDAGPLPRVPAALGSRLPETPSPAESFRRWIVQKLSDYPASILAEEDERGLIGVGVHRYHLAEVLATHVVRDVSTERGVRLERDLDAASCNSTVGVAAAASADDAKLKEFFEQVAPILTQHRGITPRSRVMMTAVAERLRLTPEELEQALATLQRYSMDPDENDPRQLERRESYRAYLRRTMAQLPEGIITFKTEERLRQAGEHFHGVVTKWIKPTMNEVAAEIGARFISKQQAWQHVTQLVQDQLTDRPVLENTTRARIYAEGTRWGLDPMDVDTILRERTETLRRRLAAERRRSRWVLNFVVGGLCVAGTLVALMFLQQPIPSDPDGQGRWEKKTPDDGATDGGDRVAWWDDDLRVAMAQVRVKRPDLRAALDDFASPQHSVRGDAYTKLVTVFGGTLSGRELQDAVQQVLASAYARDPSDAAARSLSEALLRCFAPLDTELPENTTELTAMFWACRAAVAMLKQADTPILRRNRLAEQLEKVTQAPQDLLLDRDALQRRQCAALAQRVYQLLIQSAATDPDKAGQLFRTVQDLTRDCLDPATRERLDSDFLAIVLPAVGNQWDRYASTLRGAVRSSDPNAVLKMLDVYRNTTDDRLRTYLASLFLDRLGAESGTLTEAQMIEQLRESLGIAARERDARRWNQLQAMSSELLERKRAEHPHPDVLLQEAIELAHAATLACALTRGKTGATMFDELQESGPTRLALDRGPWGEEKRDTITPSYPVPRETVQQNNIHSLINSGSVDQRMRLLRMIAAGAAGVRDIDLRSGQLLAEYLAQSKPSVQEHQEVLRHVATLARWNAVRLGLADQLLETSDGVEQAQEVYASVVEDDVSLATPEDRDAVRRRLLAQVAESSAETPSGGDARWNVFDEGAKALQDLFTTQARLLEVPAESYASATLPSQLLVTLIQHVAAQVNATGRDAADRILLDELPHRLRALDYAARNDPQYAVALQQLYLPLLAMHLTDQRPELAGPLSKLREQWKLSFARENVFEQLRDLQADQLRIWLLLRPATTDDPLEEKKA